MTDYDSMDAETKLAELLASFNLPDLKIRDDLSQKQMYALSGTFMQWAMLPATKMEDAIKLLGQARGMQDLAMLTEPDWEPPKQERPSLLVFIAQMLEERMF